MRASRGRRENRQKLSALTSSEWPSSSVNVSGADADPRTVDGACEGKFHMCNLLSRPWLFVFQRRRTVLTTREGATASVSVNNGEPHTDVMTCFPHSSIPKRPSVCAFHEAMDRRERVDVITTKPDMSPEYMHSLSPEMNSELIAEVCERMMCSGGGAEARADIVVAGCHSK